MHRKNQPTSIEQELGVVKDELTTPLEEAEEKFQENFLFYRAQLPEYLEELEELKRNDQNKLNGCIFQLMDTSPIGKRVKVVKPCYVLAPEGLYYIKENEISITQEHLLEIPQNLIDKIWTKLREKLTNKVDQPKNHFNREARAISPFEANLIVTIKLEALLRKIEECAKKNLFDCDFKFLMEHLSELGKNEHAKSRIIYWIKFIKLQFEKAPQKLQELFKYVTEKEADFKNQLAKETEKLRGSDPGKGLPDHQQSLRSEQKARSEPGPSSHSAALTPTPSNVQGPTPERNRGQTRSPQSHSSPGPINGVVQSISVPGSEHLPAAAASPTRQAATVANGITQPQSRSDQNPPRPDRKHSANRQPRPAYQDARRSPDHLTLPFSPIKEGQPKPRSPSPSLLAMAGADISRNSPKPDLKIDTNTSPTHQSLGSRNSGSPLTPGTSGNTGLFSKDAIVEQPKTRRETAVEERERLRAEREARRLARQSPQSALTQGAHNILASGQFTSNKSSPKPVDQAGRGRGRSPSKRSSGSE